MAREKVPTVDDLVAILEERKPIMMRTARRAMGSWHAAEDVFQTTVFKAIRGLERFDGRSHPGTWVTRILFNTVKDYRSYAYRAHDVSLETAMDIDTADTDPSVDPEAYVLRKEAYEQMIADISALPEHHRTEVFLDAYGFTRQEIANLIGKPLGTVKTNIYRGREQIRENREAA